MMKTTNQLKRRNERRKLNFETMNLHLKKEIHIILHFMMIKKVLADVNIAGKQPKFIARNAKLTFVRFLKGTAS